MTNTMIRTIVLFTTLLALSSNGFAQRSAAAQSTAVLQSCLLGTGPSMWSSLKLTTDQMERARRIQEACKEECIAAGAKHRNDGVSAADGSTIISELKNVLTTEQYGAWLAYCGSQTTGAEVK